MGSGHAGDQEINTSFGSFKAEQGSWAVMGLIFNTDQGSKVRSLRPTSVTQTELVSKKQKTSKQAKTNTQELLQSKQVSQGQPSSPTSPCLQ